MSNNGHTYPNWFERVIYSRNNPLKSKQNKSKNKSAYGEPTVITTVYKIGEVAMDYWDQKVGSLI